MDEKIVTVNKNSLLSIAEIFEQLPWHLLPASAQVDFFLFVSGIKPALRTKMKSAKDQDEIIPLLNALKRDILIDETGFCIISHNNEYSKRILTTDKSFEPHERELGELLGYPACCAKHCSNIGESNIDIYAKEFTYNAHEQNMELLNISHYEQGFSLISHIPCSYHCQPSINMAKESLRQLLKQPNHGKIHRWRTQVLGCLKLPH